MANSTAERQIVSLKIVHTSDVHGTFFMRDYVNNHAVRGSLSRVYAYNFSNLSNIFSSIFCGMPRPVSLTPILTDWWSTS